jgi:hypothetical protein
VQTGRDRFNDLTLLEAVNTLNEAFCERHAKHCLLDDGTVHPTVQKECNRTFALAEEIRLEYLTLGSAVSNSKDSLCRDLNEGCESRVQEGQCVSNSGALAPHRSHLQGWLHVDALQSQNVHFMVLVLVIYCCPCTLSNAAVLLNLFHI